MPLVRMHEPASIRGRTLDEYRPGERASSILLAGGVVPFDRHRLGLASITPGVGFVEESTSLLQRRWRHERTLAPGPDGTTTTITDRITAVPRFAPARPVLARVVPRIFAHRHRRLSDRFGPA